MSQLPTDTAASMPSALVVETDRNCVQCSYNIKGLPLAGKCPECGMAVSMSLKGVLLQFASPEYQGTIRSGLSMVLNGILLYIVLILTSVAMVFALGQSTSLMLILAVLGIGVQGLILFGYWRYTEPDPGFVGRDLPDTPRKIVRIAVMIQAAAAVVQLFAQVGGLAAGVGTSGIAVAVSVLSTIMSFIAFGAWIMGFFGIMRYTDWMARRLPDAHIIARVKLYIWLLPVIAIVGIIALGLGPLIALIMYWNLLDRMRKHLKAIHATGQPAYLPGQFG
jgi:hypothetical protein